MRVGNGSPSTAAIQEAIIALRYNVGDSVQQLTAARERYNGSALPDCVTIPREDGKPMAHGYILTDRERAAAVRAILGGG